MYYVSQALSRENALWEASSWLEFLATEHDRTQWPDRMMRASRDLSLARELLSPVAAPLLGSPDGTIQSLAMIILKPTFVELGYL